MGALGSPRATGGPEQDATRPSRSVADRAAFPEMQSRKDPPDLLESTGSEASNLNPSMPPVCILRRRVVPDRHRFDAGLIPINPDRLRTERWSVPRRPGAHPRAIPVDPDRPRIDPRSIRIDPGSIPDRSPTAGRALIDPGPIRIDSPCRSGSGLVAPGSICIECQSIPDRLPAASRVQIDPGSTPGQPEIGLRRSRIDTMSTPDRS